VFVEVRGRQQSSLQSGYDSVDKTKKHALRCAIFAYLKKHRHIQYWRLDIIAVEWEENGKIAALRHYENVPSRNVRGRGVY
jgi:Holliday junction resolvase-like predicted endonuclease